MGIDKGKTKKPTASTSKWGGMNIGRPLEAPRQRSQAELEAMGQLRLFPDQEVPPLRGRKSTARR
jgi:hypothetical protein